MINHNERIILATVAVSKVAIANRDEAMIKMCLLQFDSNYDTEINLEDEPYELDQLIESLEIFIEDAELGILA